jgi:non-ribosomal peptide synthetase component F
MTGIESMVGLFINTLPVRVRLTPEAMLVPWLEGIQQQQVEILQYEYTPLVQAHQWSDLPKGSPLFDSIVIVENYPVEFAIASQKQVLGVRFSGIFERLNFPLTISIEPGSELSIKIIYDSARFSETTIDRIGRQIRAVLSAFAEQDVTTLSSLQEMLRGNESDELRVKRTKLATTLRTVKRKPVRDSSTGTD